MVWQDTGRVIHRDDGSIVAGIVPLRMTGEDRLLVTAAPELLQACQSALLWLLYEGYPEDNAQVMRCADAIRKATGSEVSLG